MSYIVKTLFFLLSFVFLVLFQQSFLSHFSFLSFLNIPLLFIFLLCIFGKGFFGAFAGFLGGIILDIFSPLAFGVFTLNFTLISFFIKKLSLIFQKLNILGFSCLFFIYFISFKLFLALEGLCFSFPVDFWLKEFLVTFLFAFFALCIKKVYEYFS